MVPDASRPMFHPVYSPGPETWQPSGKPARLFTKMTIGIADVLHLLPLHEASTDPGQRAALRKPMITDLASVRDLAEKFHSILDAKRGQVRKILKLRKAGKITKRSKPREIRLSSKESG